MDNPMLMRIRRAHMIAVVLIAFGACGVEDADISMAFEDTLAITPVSEDEVDTLAVQSPESIAGQPSAAEPASPGAPSTTAPAAPAIPRVAAPSAQQPVIRAPAAAPRMEGEGIVTGRVEVEIDPRTFAPADYLLVRIEAPSHRAEAWTSREGEFYFAKVPSGRYTLEVLLSPKEVRPVYSRQFVVENGQELRVPPVHIPVTAMKEGAR